MRTGSKNAMAFIAAKQSQEARLKSNPAAATGMEYHARLHEGFTLYREHMQRQREQNVQGDAGEERVFTAPLRDPG